MEERDGSKCCDENESQVGSKRVQKQREKQRKKDLIDSLFRDNNTIYNKQAQMAGFMHI